MICPYLKRRLFWHYFWNFCLHYFEKWTKTKVFCSSKHNWEHVFFSEMLWNKISKICFYFCSKERKSELFSLLLDGSERISRVCFSFFPGPEFWAFFSSAEWFERNSESFLFCGTAGISFRNMPFVSSNPSSAELFFCRKFLTLFESTYSSWVKGVCPLKLEILYLTVVPI